MYRLAIAYCRHPLYSGKYETLEDAVQALVDNEKRAVICTIFKKGDGNTWEQVPPGEYLGLTIRLRTQEVK